MIFNRLPTILTLRPRTVDYRIRSENGVTHLDLDHIEQRPWSGATTIYFVLIGFWFGAVWLTFAWVIGLLVVTLPSLILDVQPDQRSDDTTTTLVSFITDLFPAIPRRPALTRRKKDGVVQGACC